MANKDFSDFCITCSKNQCVCNPATKAASDHNMATVYEIENAKLDGIASRKSGLNENTTYDAAVEERGVFPGRSDSYEDYGKDLMQIDVFGGTPEESLADWLRNLRIFARIRPGMVGKLHLWAATRLRGEAGYWFDSLPTEPRNFNDFCEAINERFGTPKRSKSEILQKILGRKQNPGESLVRFATQIFKMGEEINADEEVLIECVLKNIADKNLRSLLNIQLSNNYNKNSLLKLIKYADNEQNSFGEVGVSHSDVQEIVDKIDKFMNLTNKNVGKIRNTSLRNNKRCYLCDREGHIAKDCYSKRQERTFIKDKTVETEGKGDDRTTLRAIEEKLGHRIKGTVEQLLNEITNKTDNLIKFSSLIPKKFDAIKTIKSNKIFAYEILKSLESKQVNTFNVEKWNDDVDIIKVEIELDGKKYKAVIDTGANSSVIRNEIVQELDIPVFRQKSNRLQMANGDIMESVGVTNIVTFYINDTMTNCRFSVIEGASQPILLGTD